MKLFPAGENKHDGASRRIETTFLRRKKPERS
jgi:hypothetical protein